MTLPRLLPKMLTDSFLSCREWACNEAARKWTVLFVFRREGAGSKIFIRLRRFYCKTIQRIRGTEQEDARRSRERKTGRQRHGQRRTVECVCSNALDLPLSILTLPVLIPLFFFARTRAREFYVALHRSTAVQIVRQSNENAGRYDLLPLTRQKRLLFVTLWDPKTFFVRFFFHATKKPVITVKVSVHRNAPQKQFFESLQLLTLEAHIGVYKTPRCWFMSLVSLLFPYFQ